MPSQHWVQIEFTPNGEKTGALLFDLSRISQVKFDRVAGKLSAVVFVYDGQKNPIHVPDATWAATFKDIYLKYLKDNGGVRHTDAEAKPGVIAVAVNNHKPPSMASVKNN